MIYIITTLLIISILINFKLFFDLKNSGNLKLSQEKNLKSKEIDSLNISQSNELSFQDKIANMKLQNLQEINDLKDIHRTNLKNEFDLGVKKGIELSKIEVKITPYKNLKKEGNIGFRKEVIEVGYSYRLFSNGFPCLDPHIEIFDKVEVKEINERFIELLSEKFDLVLSKIPNSNIILTENIQNFTTKLLRKN